VGGVETVGPVVVEDKPLLFWEQSIHAVSVLLSSRKPAVVSTDELRRGVEALEPSSYESWGYYEQRGAALASLLLEKGVIMQAALDNELMGGGESFVSGSTPDVHFRAGDRVRVRPEDTRLRWRRPHLRCPGYIYGSEGVVTRYVGTFDDPFLLAFGGKGPQQPLYVVSFPLASIWQSQLGRGADGKEAPGSEDCIELDIYQEWLEPCGALSTSAQQLDHDGVCIQSGAGPQPEPVSQVQPPVHDHDHAHAHLPRPTVECNAVTNEGEDCPGKVVAAALLRLLYAQGVVTVPEVLAVVGNLENAKLRMDGACACRV
jgi:nitrile hydratase subunit alpha